MRILSKATTGVMIAGAALLVAACGGAATNNTANATMDNGTEVGNEPAMAPMNDGMPVDNNAMAAPAPAMTDGNAMPAANASNGM